MKSAVSLIPLAVTTAVFALPANAALDRQAAATLTQLAAVAASEVPGTDVLSSRDIEEIVALEADKQLIGCTDESACLAEVAGALGARFVVFSQLGQLDETLVLTLNLFDADQAKSVGRTTVEGETVSALGGQVGDAVRTLVGEAAANAGAADDDAPVKVLVMDIRIAGDDGGVPKEPSVDAPDKASFPILLASGGALLGGAALLGVGGLAAGLFALGANSSARSPEQPQKEVLQTVGIRDVSANLANTAYLFAGVAALAGGALIGVSFVGDGE